MRTRRTTIWPLISDRKAIRVETPAELYELAEVVKRFVEQQPRIEKVEVVQERAIADPYAAVQEALVRPLHSYFADMLALLIGPKRFIREHVDDSNLILSLKGAIVFFVTTLGILQVLKTQPTDLPKDLIGWLFYVIEYGIITFLAWRCAGGKAKLVNYMPAQFYLISGLFVLNTLPIEITQRLAGVVDSYRYQELIDAKNNGALLTFLFVNLDKIWLSSRPFVVVIVLGAVVHVALGVFWVTLSWGI